MCGIVGFWQQRTSLEGDLSDTILKMTSALVHRGPDDQDVWIDPTTGLALGHQRLSIIDRSAKGRQPMVSSSGRYVLTYNGEVYNFLKLRRELEARGIRFKSNTDTEVVLEGVGQWGFVGTLQRCIGMFALAYWVWMKGVNSYSGTGS